MASGVASCAGGNPSGDGCGVCVSVHELVCVEAVWHG